MIYLSFHLYNHLMPERLAIRKKEVSAYEVKNACLENDFRVLSQGIKYLPFMIGVLRKRSDYLELHGLHMNHHDVCLELGDILYIVEEALGTDEEEYRYYRYFV